MTSIKYFIKYIHTNLVVKTFVQKKLCIGGTIFFYLLMKNPKAIMFGQSR